MSALPILIVGGSGKTGARVDARLRARGIATRPVSRTSAVRFDWTAPDTWPAALHGVSAAYVTYQPDRPSKARWTRSAHSRGLRGTVVSSAWCCCPVAAARAQAAEPRCRRRAWGAWCARAGSTRTSPRAT